MIDIIECGEKTCASKSGNFCKYFRRKNYGQEFICSRFEDKEKREIRLFDENGWVMRCIECLENFKPIE